MKPRRRTLFRDDVVAPWLTLAVIVGLWWLGAQALSPNNPEPDAAIAGDAPAAAKRGTPVAPESAARTLTSAEKSGSALPPTENPAPAVPPPAMVPTPSDRAMPGPADPAALPVPVSGRDISGLVDQRPEIPVAGIDAKSLRSTFTEKRGGGRVHEAMDILAPRGTPVVAILDGRIAKLFTSAAGGLTIYQFDPQEQFCYYYAHLDSYAPDITEGQTVKRGQLIGYVGTTGNAPPGTPHLHFAIFKLGPDKKWWDGIPVDPYAVLRR